MKHFLILLTAFFAISLVACDSEDEREQNKKSNQQNATLNQHEGQRGENAD